jgi:hypothetical protein
MASGALSLHGKMATVRPRLRALLRPSLSQVITFLVVAASSLFVFSQLQPHLLFTNTLTSGGDMGAHVWLPWWVKEHLLSHGRLTGWTPDWYGGFPALTFYFPLPALMVVALSYVMPYAVAFKLVTVSGVVAMPVAGWAFGRLARLPFPVPACLAAAMVPFLFDDGYTILGGNIASTLAGEYSFSIGLSLAIVFLGLVAGGLETNKRRGWAGLLFGLIVLSHILPTIFALVGGILLVVMRLITGGSLPYQRDVSELRPRAPARLSLLRVLVAVGATITVTSFIMGLAALTKGAHNGFFFVALVAFVLTAIAVAFLAPLTSRELEPTEAPTKPRLEAVKWAVSVGLVGGLISGFWSLPFVWQSHYMNDMGWEKIGVGEDSGMKLFNQTVMNYSDALFPSDLAKVLFAGFLGAGLALYFRRRVGVFWVLIGAISVVAFIAMPQGRLWNARILPFYYLSLYMLAGWAIAELGWAAADRIKKLRDGADFAEGFQVAAPLLAFALAMVLVVPRLPAPDWWPAKVDASTLSDESLSAAQRFENQVAELLPQVWHDPAKDGANFIPSWAEWNYAGYDGKRDDGTYYKAAYPEYESLLKTIKDVGFEHGCGRVMWEYEPELDRFGTPMALMLTPMHSDDCMGSMEGLFFESSATVPYHFLNQALLSKTPSSAMRDMPYETLDVSSGIDKLQMLGTKYYLAVSPEAQQQAAQDPRLTIRASIDAAAGTDDQPRKWIMYEVADADLVAPLVNLPTVIEKPGSIETRRNGEDPSEHKLSYREAWLENTLAWYQDPNRVDQPLADDGPKDWPRVRNALENADPVPVADPARITRISSGDDRISFHVENPGSPVVVRASYFPNWEVKGAKDVYRLTPNLMVVTPTDNDVTLHYGRTLVDKAGAAMTIAGFLGVAALMRRDRKVGNLPDDGASVQQTSGEPVAPSWSSETSPHLVKVESSADGTNAEVLEIHSPPEEPKTS